MSEPTVTVDIEPIDEVQEIVIVQVQPPSNESRPDGIITTKRSTPIKRGIPLKETHGMTTEASRFKET